MPTIINALINIIEHPDNTIGEVRRSGTRINIVGDSLEEYIKNAFANTFVANSNNHIKHSQIFSWLGNQNNPPDLIIRGYDAIEVKKIGSKGDIALNSSYPHAKLESSSPMITNDCRKCESSAEWEKDIIYAVGTVTNNVIRYLFFVYGDVYAASSSIYDRIRSKVKEGLEEIPSVDFSETKELGRVNGVDPLGITDLRVRGMWIIQHPFKVYSYIEHVTVPTDNKYHIFAIIPKRKYDTFKSSDVSLLLSNNCVTKFDIKVKNPNNPSQLIDSILIRVKI